MLHVVLSSVVSKPVLYMINKFNCHCCYGKATCNMLHSKEGRNRSRRSQSVLLANLHRFDERQSREKSMSFGTSSDFLKTCLRHERKTSRPKLLKTATPSDWFSHVNIIRATSNVRRYAAAGADQPHLGMSPQSGQMQWRSTSRDAGRWTPHRHRSRLLGALGTC